MAKQHDLLRLENDFRREYTRVPRKAREAVAAEATIVRDSWRVYMRARSQYGHIPWLPKAITHTVRTDADGPAAEIGPDKRKKQGPLGNLLEFGSRNNKPHRDGYRALREREAPLETRIQIIAKGLL